MSDRDLPAFFADLQAWASSHEESAPTVHSYGELPEQHAELRLPPGDGPHPVALVAHGGFWRAAYGNDNTRALATALAAAGWATWNIEYRRVGEGGGFPMTLDDVAAARTALDTLDAPLDLQRVIAIGHSAGGHIALWLAGRGLVHGAVSLGGVCDLHAAADERLGNGAAFELMGTTPTQAAHDWTLADPIRQLPTGAPTLLVHGTHDDTVPVSQARAYHRAATAAGDPCTLLEFDGGHFEVIDPRSRVWPEIERGAASLLG